MAGDEGVSLGRLVQLAAYAVGAFYLLHRFVFEAIVVPTGSMEPTIPAGTHAFLDKVSLRLRDPRRGEIVVLQGPGEPAVELVKRVIAVSGDVVELRAKAVYLGGVEQAERYARHTRAGERLAGDDFGPWTVPPGCCFVLGDNRDESNDSSVWRDASGAPAPCVPRARVRGVVRGFF